MGVWLEGKPPADRVREFVKSEARRLREATGAVPGLTAVLVGDNKSSLSYVRTTMPSTASSSSSPCRRSCGPTK